MKKFYCLTIMIMLLACNGENVPDCFQNAGSIVQQEFIVDSFDKITVFERIELIVKEETDQKVIVETGEYLLNDIKVYVEGGRLIIMNENSCNLSRDYGITKVFVSASNLTEIRNSSGLTVSSDGILNYDNLLLKSEDSGAEDGIFHTDGDFNLQVNSESIVIVTNDLTNIFMSGSVENISIGFFSGAGRFEGRDLIAQNVTLFHRGSNDMIINPQQSLTGEIRSTGNVISINQPPVIDVEEFYTGRLIFN